MITRSAQKDKVGAKSFRADIQGLRAVAVLAVVADHLLPWPSGGFVGVDVFFVISGFLITGLLLREHDRSGTLSFSGFYKRRVRRILPAATVVLVVTVVLSFVLFNPVRADQTLWDGVWSFFFAGNWRFAVVGTDYFTVGGPVSPLQHFWSLSVEEQFYFVWPWLMLFILLIAGRSLKWDTRASRRAVGVTMAAIVALSFWWAMVETANNPTLAYFSTFSRAWELGIGALLAVYSAPFYRIPAWLRSVLGWLGLAGILLSVFLLDDSMPFPGPWAAAPVLSTALLIVAGTGGEQRSLWPITNPASRYIGDISYSLYLWHFPVIVFLGSILPAGSFEYVGLATIGMLLLSVLSFHFVERPVLRSLWLRDVSEGERRSIRSVREQQRRNRRHRSSSGLATAPALIGLSALAVGTAVLVAAALGSQTPLVSATVGQERFSFESGPSSTPDAPLAPADELSSQIRAALNAQSWPQFNPPVDGSVQLRVPQWVDDRCLNVSDDNLDSCVYGAKGGAKTAVVLGDSVATSWFPGLIAALEPLGYEIRAMTLEKCPFGNAAVTSSEDSGGPLYQKCLDHHAWASAKVVEMQPELIVISDSFYGLDRLISEAEGADAVNEWATGFTESLDALPSESKKIVLMSPPSARNMAECYTPVSNPAACVADLRQSWIAVQEAEAQASLERGVPFVDTRDWFCFNSRCPSFIGTTAIYADSAHLTRDFSAMLGPVLLNEFRAQEVVN